ncbi:hypothetical protein R1sor_025737 [Riccia sorocarpa]|uniref:TCTP domain-containing protein n=1 Tax=Riccia sorocarpa TaxID=122646 RepID=A0ABD3GDD3_9MARC
MLVYQDLLTADELLDNSFPINKELVDGVLWEVEGKWVTKEPVKVDVAVNRPADKGDPDFSVHDEPKKVIDVVDTFQLQEKSVVTDDATLVDTVKKYVDNLTPKVSADRQAHIKKNFHAAIKYLSGKVKDRKLYVGESMKDECAPVFCYYKEGTTNPTFVYFADGQPKAELAD